MSDDPVIKSWAITVQTVRAEIFHVPPEDMRRIFQHIEALTSERDHAWEMVAKADTQVGQALAERLQDKAQIDRLRAALWEILACETPNANATVTRMATIARAALKGETP